MATDTPPDNYLEQLRQISDELGRKAAAKGGTSTSDSYFKLLVELEKMRESAYEAWIELTIENGYEIVAAYEDGFRKGYRTAFDASLAVSSTETGS